MTRKTALKIVRSIYALTDCPVHLRGLIYVERARSKEDTFFRVVFRGEKAYPISFPFTIDGEPI